MNEKETMNVQMEKFFFTWILDHSSQFFNVEPEYFKNDEIRFIYKVVRDEYIISKNIPTPQQIVAMIKLHDPEEKINNNWQTVINPATHAPIVRTKLMYFKTNSEPVGTATTSNQTTNAAIHL